MILTELTQLEAPAERGSRFRVTRFLAALALLESYRPVWDAATSADFLRTVRQMIDHGDAAHWARMLDTGAMPDPGDPGWSDWYADATEELKQAYDRLPTFRVQDPPAVSQANPLGRVSG